MILYKYVSFETAVSILDNSSVGFSSLKDLNDPFEGHATRFSPPQEKGVPQNVAANAFRTRYSSRFGILSLTRQPLNPLMWSHYGDQHKGVVIGIDVEKAGFMDPETCAIPAHYGEVIYTATFPEDIPGQPGTDELLSIGEEKQRLEPHMFSIFRRAFLYKSMDWCYEEEVRVIKNIYPEPYISNRKHNVHFSNDAGNWLQLQSDHRPLYCLSIPTESITDVYLGRHWHKLNRKEVKNNLIFKPLEEIDKWMKRNIKVHQCLEQKGSWGLQASLTHFYEKPELLQDLLGE